MVIAGTADPDRMILSTTRTSFKCYAGRLEVQYLDTLSVAQTVAAVQALPPDSAVLYLTKFRDGGALAAPSTSYIYDWNLLPIGQLLWLKELETYKTYPSLQTPASYNLDQVIEAMKSAKHISHVGK
jgi:hypothetical protein